MGSGGRAPLILNLCTCSCPGHFTCGERTLGGHPCLCGLSGEEIKLLTFLGIKLWFFRLEACVVMILTELSSLPQMTLLILVCLLNGGGMWITRHSICLLILYLCTRLYICESDIGLHLVHRSWGYERKVCCLSVTHCMQSTYNIDAYSCQNFNFIATVVMVWGFVVLTHRHLPLIFDLSDMTWGFQDSVHWHTFKDMPHHK